MKYCCFLNGSPCEPMIIEATDIVHAAERYAEIIDVKYRDGEACRCGDDVLISVMPADTYTDVTVSCSMSPTYRATTGDQ